jgi:hypothetical protein
LELEPRRLHVIQVGAPGKDAGPRWIGEATGLGMYKWEYRYLRPYRYSSRQEAVLRREFRKKALEQDKFAVQYARLQFVERNPFVDQLRPHIIRLIKSDYEISWFWKNEPCDRTGYVLKPRPKFYWNALKKEEEV